MVMPDNAPAPIGYLKWGSTWISEVYQLAGWGFGVNRFNYDSIHIDNKAFDSPAEKQRVMGWLTKLAKYKGKPFPSDIDANFAKLARERAARAPLRTYVVLPVERAIALWSNPFSSFGWPNELPSRVGDQQRLQASRNSEALMTLARAYPFRALSKAFTGFYRLALLGAFVVITAFSFGRQLSDFRRVVWIVAAWIAARTVFLSVTNVFETRYTAVTTPAIELVVVLGLFILLGRRGALRIEPITFGAKAPSVS